MKFGVGGYFAHDADGSRQLHRVAIFLHAHFEQQEQELWVLLASLQTHRRYLNSIADYVYPEYPVIHVRQLSAHHYTEYILYLLFHISVGIPTLPSILNI